MGRAPSTICVITHPLSAAGAPAAESLLQILSEITEVSVISANVPETSSIRHEYEFIEIDDHRSARQPVLTAALRFIRNQLQIAAAVSSRKEDTVLFFGATAYLIPIVVSRIMGKRVILEPRGDVPLTLRLYWERRMPTAVARGLEHLLRAVEWVGYALATDIIVYTPSMAAELGLDSFASKLQTAGARFVDIDRFRPQVPLGDRPMQVGYVGRLDEEKGIRTLVEVARRLPDDVKWVFGGDGALMEWATRELHREADAGQVEMLGWVNHDAMPEVLNQLRLLIIPSRPTEGLPMTVLEAMACGTPVLATPVSGIPDVIQHGETGYLIEETTPAELTAQIGMILQEEDLASIGRAARSAIQNDFTHTDAVRRYDSIL
jgi:glycosyltransferase involved in cell wall biosynthesis